jgi:hypothetical protein
VGTDRFIGKEEAVKGGGKEGRRGMRLRRFLRRESI